VKLNSYDFIKQSIGLRLDNVIQLGCQLLMYDNAYHKKPLLTDEEVRSKILSAINQLTNKKHKSKIKFFAEWTEQERIDEFTRNRELILSGEIGSAQDGSYDTYYYDISNPRCLWNFADMCFLIAIMYCNYYAEDEDDFELLKVIDFFDTTISKKSHEVIGYWKPKLKTRMSYVNSQGQNSLEVGQCTINIAKDVLQKCGGIKGYDNLPRGKKGKVIDEIAKAVQFKDDRQVYKILNKLRNNKRN